MRMNIHAHGELTRVVFGEEIGEFCVTERTCEDVQEM